MLSSLRQRRWQRDGFVSQVVGMNGYVPTHMATACRLHLAGFTAAVPAGSWQIYGGNELVSLAVLLRSLGLNSRRARRWSGMNGSHNFNGLESVT
jgi:hypothetical protein